MTQALHYVIVRWMGAITGVLLMFSVAGLFMLAADRRPPYKLLSYTASQAYPGGEVRFVSSVWRDRSRDCTASLTWFIRDSAGTIRLAGRGDYTDVLTDEMERLTAGESDIAVPVSPHTALGWATVRSVMMYRCNITQWIRPIEVVVERRFLVVPHLPGAIFPGWIEPQERPLRNLLGLT